MIDKKELKALVAHMYRYTDRPGIDGLIVLPDQLVATDGHRLVALRLEGVNSFAPVAIPYTICKRALATATTNSDISVVLRQDEVGLAVDGREDVVPRAEAGSPPNLEAIMSDDRDEYSAPIGVNLTYLADLALIARAIPGKQRAASLTVGGPLEPLRLESERWLALVMPMRL